MRSVLLYFALIFAQAGASYMSVTYLEPGDTRTYELDSSSKRFGSFEPDLQIYCYRGQTKTVAALFQSIRFRLNIENDDFVQFEGDSPDEVKTHYDNQRTIFSFNVLNVGKRKLIKIDPFNQTCIGVETAHKYTVHLSMVRVDFARVILLVGGLLIFFYARLLSQTPLFYYLTGIFLGIFASFLVVVYFGSKLFPKRPMMYGMLVGGWTVGIYFLQILFENLHTILVVYQTYVFWYVIVTGFISFVVCYRLGPPKNQRSKDLIKWGLQLAANIMIFYSSSFHEATVSIMIVTICCYYFPITLIRKIKGIWIKRFPPKPKLLTSEEFYEQGVLETTRALEDLKNFCNSPESKPWRMMTRLKDPQRFASFIEGGSHLEDEEILDYETTQIERDDDDVNTDDEDDLMTDSD